MELLWAQAPLAVREVQGRVARGKLAYTTLMTTLDRLYKKGLLARDKVGLSFVYRPAIDRDEYQRRVVEAAVAPFLEQGSRAVLAPSGCGTPTRRRTRAPTRSRARSCAWREPRSSCGSAPSLHSRPPAISCWPRA
jgi:hypothetical protein